MTNMDNRGLSFQSRKALMANIGETAATEISELISQLVCEVEDLRRTKVNVTRIVPSSHDCAQEFIEEPI